MDRSKTHFQNGSAGSTGEGENGLSESMNIIREIVCNSAAASKASKAPRSFRPGERRVSVVAASAMPSDGLQHPWATTDASRGDDNVDTHHINRATSNPPRSQTTSVTFGGQYPCPFRQRNPARFNVRDSDTCARAWFADVSAVKRHVRVHHRRSNRPFICQCCKEGFLSNSGLSEHVKSRSCAWREPEEAAAQGSSRDDPEDGITPAVDGLLADRKSGGGGVHTWDAVWGVLFPRDGAPVDPVFQPIVELSELDQAFETSKPALKAGLQSILRDVVQQQLLSLQQAGDGDNNKARDSGDSSKARDSGEAFSLFLAGSVELAVEAHWHGLVRECSSRAQPLGPDGGGGTRAARPETTKAGKHQDQPAARVGWHGSRAASLSKRRGSMTVFTDGRTLQRYSMSSSGGGSESAPPSTGGSPGACLGAGSQSARPRPSSVQYADRRSIAHSSSSSTAQEQPDDDAQRPVSDWATSVPDAVPVQESMVGSWLAAGAEQQARADPAEEAPWNNSRPRAGTPIMLLPNIHINIHPKQDTSEIERLFPTAPFVASPTVTFSSSGAGASSSTDRHHRRQHHHQHHHRHRHLSGDDLGPPPARQVWSPKPPPAGEQRDSGIDLAYDLARRSGSVRRTRTPRTEPHLPTPDPSCSDSDLECASASASVSDWNRAGGKATAAERPSKPATSRHTPSRHATDQDAARVGRPPRELSKQAPTTPTALAMADGDPARRGRGDGFAPNSFRRRISPEP